MLNLMKSAPARQPIPFLFTPPDALFVIPAGDYRAVLKTVSKEESEMEEGRKLIRFVFDLIADEIGPVSYSAALEYLDDEAGQAKLNKDLAVFLEPCEIDQMLGIPGEIDLSELVGTEVDMTIATFTSKEEPYSRIIEIHRAGNLITGEMMALGENGYMAQARSRWKTPVQGSTLIEIPTTASGRKLG